MFINYVMQEEADSYHNVPVRSIFVLSHSLSQRNLSQNASYTFSHKYCALISKRNEWKVLYRFITGHLAKQLNRS